MHRLAVSRAPAALWLSLLLLVLVAAAGGGARGADCNENGRPDDEDIAPLHIGFGEPLEFEVGPRGQTARNAALADYDGDGHLDVVVATESSLSLLRNRGGGVLGEPVRLAILSTRAETIAADLDQDGRPDVVCLAGRQAFDSAVAVLRNAGGGAFEEPEIHLLGAGFQPRQLAVAHLDGDAAPDLVIGDFEGKLVVLLNDVSGSFTARAHVIGSESARFLVSDLNGDGRLDILADSFPARIHKLLENQGDGSFTVRDVVLEPFSFLEHAADFDGDGSNDVSNGLRLYRNLGGARFTAGEEIRPALPLVRYLLGDVDGDGRPDFYGSGNTPAFGLLVALNSRDGSFEPALGFAKQPHLRPAALGDLNGDGDLDVFGTSLSCNRGFIMWRLPGLFPQSADLDRNGVPDECQKDCNENGIPDAYEIARGEAADCNGNGIPDACETGGSLAFRETWTNLDFPAFSGGRSLLADLNGDSYLDFVPLIEERLDPPIVDRGVNEQAVITVRRRPFILWNDGGGAFPRQTELADAGFPSDLAAADLDGDGDVDFVAADFLQKSVRIFLNSGDGMFAVGLEEPLEQRPWLIEALDLDGDGNIDLLATVSGLTATLICFPGRGGGEFAEWRPLLSGVNQPLLADLNGDGWPDLASDEQGNVVEVRFNEGDFRFAARRRLAAGRLVAAVDVEADGRADLIVASPLCSRRFVLRHLEGPMFEEIDAFAAPGQWTYLAAADLDGDGAVDLATWEVGGIGILRNDRTGRFSAPRFFQTSLPAVPAWASFMAWAGDLNLDGSADLLVSRFSGSGLTVLLNALERSPDLDQNGIPDECEAGTGQVRGDANQDGAFNLSDPVWLLAHLFLGAGTRLPCSGGDAGDPGPADLELLDASDDGRLDLSDAVAMLRFLFQGEPSPLALGGGCEAVGGCPTTCSR